MTAEVLTFDEVQQRLADRRQAEATEATNAGTEQYQFLRPVTTAAEGLIEYLENPQGRFMLGLHDVDVMTRGFGRGELVYVTGHAHSGKTQVLLNAIVNNPDSVILMFTPDEPAELVLAKLVSIIHGINSEDIEELIKDGHAETARMVRDTAARSLKNLVIIDEPLSWENMRIAYEEAVDYYGRVDVCIFDFLEQLPGSSDGDAEGVAAKSLQLKRWVKSANVVGICIHQRSRSSGGSSAKRGQAAGMGGMRYGGENDAIFVVEVFRKCDDEDLDAFERERERNTITVNVCKNKRPPCKKGMVDLYLEPTTGLVRELRSGDRRQSSAAQRAWETRQ